MTCREFADFMTDYLSGDMPADVRMRFDDHLRRCANCRRYLSSFEQSVTLGQHAYDDATADVPCDVPEDLVKAILQARRG